MSEREGWERKGKEREGKSKETGPHTPSPDDHRGVVYLLFAIYATESENDS